MGKGATESSTEGADSRAFESLGELLLGEGLHPQTFPDFDGETLLRLGDRVGVVGASISVLSKGKAEK